MLSTFEAENRHLNKHTEPQLKKRCAYKKNVYIVPLSKYSSAEFPMQINPMYSAHTAILRLLLLLVV